MNDSPNKMETIFLVILVLFLLGLFFFDGEDNSTNDYQVNYNLSSVNAPIQEPDLFPKVSENHWDHMPLTYSISPDCQNFSIIKEENKGRYVVKIEKGLDYITNVTNDAIRFMRVENKESDILFYCPFHIKSEEGKIVIELNVHTLAVTETSIFTNSNLFAKSEISFTSSEGCPSSELPVDVIHEVGHSLGLEHNINPARQFDIMNPLQQDCIKARFLKKDLEYLWRIYDPNNIYRPYKEKYSCQTHYYDCLDFATQKDAQEVLEFCGINKDPHKFDIDKDGKACEHLP
ncbi:MAG: matrixin family metalloprotease [Nanoarchaeota archaeon]|nr:matrixin family metalloprotease [Nanoarchaeota archaeon]